MNEVNEIENHEESNKAINIVLGLIVVIWMTIIFTPIFFPDAGRHFSFLTKDASDMMRYDAQYWEDWRDCTRDYHYSMKRCDYDEVKNFRIERRYSF